MITLHFHKMNGAGNDFVVIDNRKLDTNLNREQIAWLCDRQRGVGADGLLAVEPAEHEADYKFRYYNADGGEAEMCGNGARCFGKYTAQLSSPAKKSSTSKRSLEFSAPNCSKMMCVLPCQTLPILNSMPPFKSRDWMTRSTC